MAKFFYLCIFLEGAIDFIVEKTPPAWKIGRRKAVMLNYGGLPPIVRPLLVDLFIFLGRVKRALAARLHSVLGTS